MVIYRTMEYKEGEEIYAEAAELVQLPDLSDLPDPVLEETEETEETDAPVYVDPYADALLQHGFRRSAGSEQRCAGVDPHPQYRDLLSACAGR